MTQGSKRSAQPLSLDGLRTTSLASRPSKVDAARFAKPWHAGQPFRDFAASLPACLAADQLRQAVHAITQAVRHGRTVLLGMGAHVIKVGLNPILIDAIRRGLINGLALNGAGIIHDVELALAGKTSEDVGAHLHTGQFGTAREPAELIHAAVARGYAQGSVGLGQAVGLLLLEQAPAHLDLSLLAAAARHAVPVTVHVALGTDIIHMHPAMDGAAMGALSYHDFRVFCRLVSSLEQGVFINAGSAVIIPEVFLKAVNVAHNLGYSLDGLTTINMDFQRHYRPQVNVVERPTADCGTGITLIGHHEIMLPLLFAMVQEDLASGSNHA
jgi:hypothetical protein